MNQSPANPHHQITTGSERMNDLQRMSDERFAEFGGMCLDAQSHGRELYQALKADRAHSDSLVDIANTCADQRDTATAIVDEAKAFLSFFAPVLRAEGLPKAVDELHTILYPPQEPKE